MPANLNPSYAPIGGGGRTIAIGVPDDLPTGYHWVRNLLNGQTTGGSQTSYSTGTNNSNFTEGSTNCLSAVYAKDAGNTGPGALQITIPLGCIRTGPDPTPPTVSVDVSNMPGFSGLKADYSGDGLVTPFKCKISTVQGVGESGTVTVNYTPPTGFKGILWYTVAVGGYVNGVAVNQNYADNTNYNVRGIPLSESGWDRGGGTWRGTQRGLVYPISTNLQSYVVNQNSPSPNFIIGDYNNADGVDTLTVQITRGDYWSSNKLQWENSGNPILMNLASGYTTTYGYATENGRTYVPPDVNNAGCVSYRPPDSVELSPYSVVQANLPGVPLGGAYVLSGNQCGTPFVDCPYMIGASTTILQTDVTITVYLEKAPDPIPAITSATSYCYSTGGTVTVTGTNLSTATKVYDYQGNVITGATITATGDTSAEITIPASPYGGAIGLSSGSGQIGWTSAYNSCPPGEPTYPQYPRLPQPPQQPTPTPPVPTACMDGWNFGIEQALDILQNGPKVVSYDGTVFMSGTPGTWILSAITNTLTFDIQDIYTTNGVHLNPGLGEIIRIIDWRYPFNGNYYVIGNQVAGTTTRILTLSCTNTSLTPTPSPIQTGTCIAPANTNTGPFAFPTSPSINQIYSFNGRAWYWNSYAWNRYCVGVTPLPITPIVTPSPGNARYYLRCVGSSPWTAGEIPTSSCSSDCFSGWLCNNNLNSRATITGQTSGAIWTGLYTIGDSASGSLDLERRPPSPPYFWSLKGVDPNQHAASQNITQNGNFIVNEVVVITNSDEPSNVYGSYSAYNGTYVIAAIV